MVSALPIPEGPVGSLLQLLEPEVVKKALHVDGGARGLCVASHARVVIIPLAPRFKLLNLLLMQDNVPRDPFKARFGYRCLPAEPARQHHLHEGTPILAFKYKSSAVVPLPKRVAVRLIEACPVII